MQPNTILWDQEVRGFVARRQFCDVVTFSVVYRTKEECAAMAEAGALPDPNASSGATGSHTRASRQGAGPRPCWREDGATERT